MGSPSLWALLTFSTGSDSSSLSTVHEGSTRLNGSSLTNAKPPLLLLQIPPPRLVRELHGIQDRRQDVYLLNAGVI